MATAPSEPAGPARPAPGLPCTRDQQPVGVGGVYHLHQRLHDPDDRVRVVAQARH